MFKKIFDSCSLYKILYLWTRFSEHICSSLFGLRIKSILKQHVFVFANELPRRLRSSSVSTGFGFPERRAERVEGGVGGVTPLCIFLLRLTGTGILVASRKIFGRFKLVEYCETELESR